MNKDLKRFFLCLGLFAFGDGLFYNFQEVWLVENGMTVKTVSLIFSLCALLCVSVIFLCSNLIKHNALKKFFDYALLTKFIIIFSMYFLHKTNLNFIIKFLTMADYVIDVEIFASIYPIISHISKTDKTYALRRLIYISTYYLGSLLASLFLGRTICYIFFDYNTYNLFSALFIFLSFLCSYKIEFNKYIKKNEKEDSEILYKVVKKIKKDKISKYFLLYIFLEKISFYSVCGIMLTVLIHTLKIEANIASNIILVLGIISVMAAGLFMKFFTSDNHIINISIKYASRIILAIIAIILNNSYFYVITLFYYTISNEIYINAIDAPFINRYSTVEQFSFNNFVEMCTYLARGLGVYICGIALREGMRINFSLSLLFLIAQIITIICAFKLYTSEKRHHV